MMWRAMRWVLLMTGLGLVGCQAMGGFEAFETGNSAGRQPPPVSEGLPCATADACGDDVCLFGYCRRSCHSTADCDPASTCFSDGVVAGCRLGSDVETKCSGACANASLACGIDGTCRTSCSTTKPCARTGEDCIQNTCVDEEEADWAAVWGQCGDPRGETTCGDDGRTLTACNVTRPGKVVIATCASAALCIKGKQSAPPSCASPLCGSGATDPTEAKCVDGKLLTCSADQQTFDATDCAPMRCDPAGRRCLAISIDEKEVTRAEYAKFLAANPPLADQSPGCAWNGSFAPDLACLALPDVCNPAASSCDAVPQVCVDWCDAYAYCRWTGRHLCGKLGADAMVTLSQSDDPGQSEWMNACSAGGQYAWNESNAWSAPLEGQACNGSAKTAYINGGVYPAGTLAQCHSPVSSYADVLDMSGNVAEWENSCSMDVNSARASRDDTCRVRGGSFKSGETQLRCDAHPQDRARSAVGSDLGFRCCG